MTLLLTGATGFVGRHLAVELARRSLPARGLVRREAVSLPPGVTRVFIRSFDDSAALVRACSGCTAVVHLAARVHVVRDRARDSVGEFRHVNVDGTGAVLDAAVRVGARRFLFLSSVKVNGEGTSRPYTEKDPPGPEDPYAVSKWEAETLVRGYDDRIETVILRPPLVYGPGVEANFRRLLRLSEVSRRIPLPLAGLRNRRSFIYVGNLVDAILHLLQAPEARGQTFLVSDGEDLSTTELVQRIGRAGGFTPRMLPFPSGFLRFAGRLMGKGAEMKRLTESLTVDAAALRATGWRPPYSIDQGLAETVRWWQDHRGLSRT